MHEILSYFLDNSIDTNNISVINSDAASIYFIPYDEAFFDEILANVPQLLSEFQVTDYGVANDYGFYLLCQYSHVGPDNRLYAKYQLRLDGTILATETVPMSNKTRPKPNSLLRAAKKSANKIITQERLALKQGMLKTLRTDFEYES